MNGGSQIIGIRPPQEDDGATLGEAAIESPAPETIGDPDYWEDPVEEPPREGPAWLPALAILATLAWIGGMVALSWTALIAMDPVGVVQFAAALLVPPLVLGMLWLIVQRNSRAEARRFGVTARAMRAEASALDHVVAALSHRIEASRSSLAAQSHELLTMGDRAAGRLEAVSSGMAQEAKALHGAARVLVDSAGQAEQKLTVTLAMMPKAHGELGQMATTLESLGLSASERVAGLDAQFAALAERGREADTVAGGAAQRLAAHIARMEAMSETAGARLEAVAGEMSATVDGVLDRAAQAVDEARKGITAQGDATLAMLSASHDAIERSGREGSDALAERIAAVEAAIDRIAARLGDEQARSDALFASLDHGLVETSAQFDVLHQIGLDRTRDLSASVSALTQGADAATQAIRQGHETADAMIGSADALLTALDAATREIDETLPEALRRLDTRIGESRAVVAASKPELLALVAAAESTHDAIEAIAGVIADQRRGMEALGQELTATLDDGRVRIDGIETTVASTIERTDAFVQRSAPALVQALDQMRDSAARTADQARAALASVIPQAAQRLEAEGTAALSRSIGAAVSEQIADLTAAADQAVIAATRASDAIAERMLTIRETTAAIEARIDDAREAIETADHDNLSRRVSLLIEALNSTAIDITKSFAHDVSDSAWAAYLKGDRGVFTRRAVRLIDNGQAREISALYDTDDNFRAQVNRYIHDFEAMLRQILATRDGSPLGVTVLSSDMGKLYVALAQAIERLRA
ncbi:hypothetical protein [Sphingomonas japonica]|uniref:Nucleic acid-binding Zn-ribbon protein n=1 Tax=Sphingomonas japonica TaxID=511662 RepID=A0ABX0U810_9SPHN|nr:hypothetical protein [Sphingomonas japonica]NIJ24903.1 putative nucleic acid-binding Zn-ribbon protein [Sphingomonas japonica]